MLLLQGFSVFVWNSITAEQSKLEKDIAFLRQLIDDRISKLDAEFIRRQEAQIFNVQLKSLSDKVDLDEAAARRMRDTYLRVDNYTGQHAQVTLEIGRVAARLEEVRKEFGAAYTLGDRIKEFQDQLKRLQDQINTHKVEPATNGKP